MSKILIQYIGRLYGLLMYECCKLLTTGNLNRSVYLPFVKLIYRGPFLRTKFGTYRRTGGVPSIPIFIIFGIFKLYKLMTMQFQNYVFKQSDIVTSFNKRHRKFLRYYVPPNFHLNP